ncbi:MAG: PLP-dependent aspartate aminotransferase family protein [Acidimicrobiia bacterium]
MTSSDLRTLAVSAGRPDRAGAPLNEGMIPASNFLLGGDRAYARDDGTPTWIALERLVGALEDGETVAFASGMAAIAAVFDLVPVGGQIVWPDDCYQGVAGLIQQGERSGRWTSVRLGVAATERWCQAAASADLIWIESPSNPLLDVADLRRIGATPRRPGSLLAVDNTLAGPLAQQPLTLGADVSIQSATKHLGGHSDLLCGVATTRQLRLLEQLRTQRELRGATPGTLEAFLVTRGMRTYPLRAEASARSANEIAARLQRHIAVEIVRYPGLASHPTHAIAVEQLAHFGSVISFDVTGGAAAADEVCARVELVRHATSFGAVESTIERRASVPGQEHLPPGLLRLSVGIEHVEDIWTDIAAALVAAR